MMVMAKPIEFCKASPAPKFSGGQAAEDSAENCGESAITDALQIISTSNINHSGKERQPIAKIRQLRPDVNKAPIATLSLPYFFDQYPPNRQPKAPKAITKKVVKARLEKRSMFNTPE